MTGDNAARRAEDIDGQELSYAEVKAIASGNPAVLTLAEADAELQRLAILKKNHLDEQFIAQRRVRDLPPHIAGMSKRLTDLLSDEATVMAHPGDRIAISGQTFSHKDIPLILGEKLNALSFDVTASTKVPLGTYRGLSFGLMRRPQFAPDVYLEGRTTRQTLLARDHPGPRAVLNELERMADSYHSVIAEVREDLAVAEGQLRDYRLRLGKPFALEGYTADLTSLRDQLRHALSDAAPESEDGKRPGISNLAERIKLLKAAHHVESAPERVRPKIPAAKRGIVPPTPESLN
jgi:hypothetical protein